MATSFDLTDSQIAVSKLAVLHLGSVGRGFNPRQQIMDMVNVASVKKYSMDAWDFSSVARTTNGSIHNTTAAITSSLIGNGMFNKRLIQYNRIHVGDLGIIKVPKGSATHVLDLLNSINSLCSTFIEEQDIVNDPLPSVDVDGNVTISLVFQSSALQFYSGVRIILLSEIPSAPFTAADIGLDQVDNTRDIFKPVSIYDAVAIADAKSEAIRLANEYSQSLVIDLSNADPNGIIDGGNF